MVAIIGKERPPVCQNGHTLITFDFFPRLFRILVNDIFTPSICVPPSTVRMLLAYPNIVSEYASEHLAKNE